MMLKLNEVVSGGQVALVQKMGKVVKSHKETLSSRRYLVEP